MNICCLNDGSKVLNSGPLATPRSLHLKQFLNPTLFYLYCLVALFPHTHTTYTVDNTTLNMIKLKRYLRHQKRVRNLQIKRRERMRVFTKWITPIKSIFTSLHLSPPSWKRVITRSRSFLIPCKKRFPHLLLLLLIFNKRFDVIKLHQYLAFKFMLFLTQFL
jgi:hypothetical protein